VLPGGVGGVRLLTVGGGGVDADSVWKEGSRVGGKEESGDQKQSVQGVDVGRADYPEGVQNSMGRTAEGPK